MSQIAELYAEFVEGSMERSDARWLEVHKFLRAVADRTTLNVARNLFGMPLQDIAEDVYSRLLMKFLRMQFPKSPKLESIIFTSARRDVITSFRRDRRPQQVSSFEGAEATWQAPDDEDEEIEVDIFREARARLKPYRFPEYPLVREMVLAYFLSHASYPGIDFLKTMSIRRDA